MWLLKCVTRVPLNTSVERINAAPAGGWFFDLVWFRLFLACTSRLRWISSAHTRVVIESASTLHFSPRASREPRENAHEREVQATAPKTSEKRWCGVSDQDLCCYVLLALALTLWLCTYTTRLFLPRDGEVAIRHNESVCVGKLTMNSHSYSPVFCLFAC